ncbi:MAG: hypothetical protein H7A12_00285 [Pseudomonadales bacterium]|jgi:CRISPR-associated protein Csm5|nr:hypothetical protein [Pseudomonadales bacterium]MCP5338390.1 hypothetical protein [Pseudomonadales bacterium]
MTTSWMTNETLNVSTLGPLHLGCGEDYLPTAYVMDENYLYAIPELRLPAVLGKQAMAELAKAAMDGGDDGLRRIQARIEREKARLIPYATHRVVVPQAIFQHYNTRVGQVAQREQDGKSVINRLAIQRTARNPIDQRVLLAGCAVKGAIRTAVLDALNAGHKAPPPSRELRPVERFDKLQKKLLDFREVNEDPFRLLKLSDAYYAHADDLLSAEIRVAVSVKRKPVAGRSAATINTFLECVAPWRSRCFELTVSLHDRELAENDSRRKERTGKPFNLPKDLDGFFDRCNAYYLPKLRQELIELGEHGYFEPESGGIHWVKELQNLLAGELGGALKSGQAFLLRLGKHSGAEDKTLNGAREITIRGKKGATDQIRERTNEVRLAALRQNANSGVLPFGWVVVERPGTRLLQTHAFLRRMADPAYQQLDRLRELDTKAVAAREQAEIKERERIEREEQVRLEAKAKEERLKSLSDNGRAVETLRQRMEAGEGKGLGAGCTLASDLNRTIENASAWDAQDRSALRELAVTLYTHLGIDPKRNDKARKRLRTLE